MDEKQKVDNIFKKYYSLFKGRDRIIEGIYWKNLGRNYLYDLVAKIRIQNKIMKETTVGGISNKKSIALMKTVGEAAERYCGYLIDPKEFVTASYAQVKNNSVNPRECILFSDAQYAKSKFKYEKLDEEKEINWVYGRGLDGKQIMVPAFLVFLGYGSRLGADFRYPITSVGLAAQSTPEKACLHAILELVERDAAMIVWMNKLEVPRLDLSGSRSPELLDLISDLRKEGLTFNVVITTLDIKIPSVIAYVTSNSWPCATFGSAAGEDIEKIALKALQEALMVRQSLEIMPMSKRFKTKPKFSRIANFLDHANLYGLESMQNAFRFLENGKLISVEKARRMYGTKPSSLKLVRKALDDANLRAFYINLTRPNIALQGISVIRAVIPKIQQVDLGYDSRFLGGKRLKEVPKKLKMRGRTNRYPHPFS